MTEDDDRVVEMSLTERRKALVRDYFRKVDAGDPTLLDLYTDEVEIYFPKFGFGRGKPAMRDFAARLRADLDFLAHDIEGLQFHPSGDVIVVEGREWGRTVDGTDWPDGQVSTGRFCNVFTFEDDLISSVRVYTDPDFTSAHASRVAALHHPSSD